MGEPDLFDRLVEMANATGQDFNDGDLWPGWMATRWVENGAGEPILEITYTNPERGETVQTFRVERVA